MNRKRKKSARRRARKKPVPLKFYFWQPIGSLWPEQVKLIITGEYQEVPF